MSGLKIRNRLLGKCLQAQEGTTGGQVSLGECNPYSPVQEWQWLPKGQALTSLHTGECLTAPREEYEGVVLQPCIFKDGAGERETAGQTWTCTKKGLITLIENRLHLSATKDSSLVFLLKEHKQVVSASLTICLFCLVDLLNLMHSWIPLFGNRAASGELLITRHCAIGEMAKKTQTNLIIMWGKKKQKFHKVLYLKDTCRWQYVRTKQNLAHNYVITIVFI